MYVQVDELVKHSLNSNAIKLAVAEKCDEATVEGLQQVSDSSLSILFMVSCLF